MEINFAYVKDLGFRSATSSSYQLVDPLHATVVGRAESAIVSSDIYQGKFRGTRTIEVSGDASRILVTEDVSDALPARRYILFQREPNGLYKTFYLAPLEIEEPRIVEFGYHLPDIHLADEGFERILKSETPFTRGG